MSSERGTAIENDVKMKLRVEALDAREHGTMAKLGAGSYSAPRAAKMGFSSSRGSWVL